MNVAFEINPQSLNAFDFFILKKKSFFMLTSTFALNKIYLLSIKLFNLLAMVTKLLDCNVNILVLVIGMLNGIVNIVVGIDDSLKDPWNYGLRLKLGLVLKYEWQLRLVLSIIDYHLLSTLCVAWLFGGRGGRTLGFKEVLGSTKTSRTIGPSKSKQPNWI